MSRLAYSGSVRLPAATLVSVSIATLGGYVAYRFAEDRVVQILAILGFVSLALYTFSLLAIGEVQKRFEARGASLVFTIGSVTLACGSSTLLFVFLTITGMRWEYRLGFPVIAVVGMGVLPVLRSHRKKRTNV